VGAIVQGKAARRLRQMSVENTKQIRNVLIVFVLSSIAALAVIATTEYAKTFDVRKAEFHVREIELMGGQVTHETRYPWWNRFLPMRFRSLGANVVVGVEVPIESSQHDYSECVLKHLSELKHVEWVSLSGSVHTLGPPQAGVYRVNSKEVAALGVKVMRLVD